MPAAAHPPSSSRDMSINQLTAIPSTIGQLRALTFLYLFNNQLTTLPSTIGQLTALTYM